MSPPEWAKLLLVLFISAAIAAAIFTTINRTKPSPFIPPAIWSELHVDDDDEPIPEFSI